MAKSRELRIVVAGDSDKLTRELKKADNQLDKFGRQTRLTASVTSKGFAAMRVGATGAAAGLAGLGLAGKKVAQASIEAEKSQARLRAQLKASGISYTAHAAEIEKSIQATSRLAALDDEDLQDAFSGIVRVSGDVDKALRLTALAADIARGRNIDLATAAKAVERAAGGNTMALGRMVGGIEKGASATDVLAAAQQKFAGQAKAYGETTGGSMDRANIAFENLQETVGDKLAPSIEKAADKTSKFVNEMSDGTGQGGRFVNKLQDVWQEVRPVVTWFGRATRNIANFTAEHPGLAKLVTGIVAVGVAVKALRFVSAVTGFSAMLKGGRAAMKSLVRIFATQGAVAGAAAAGGAAGGQGFTSAASFNKMRDSGRRVGKVMGRGIVTGVTLGIALYADDITKKLYEKIGRRGTATGLGQALYNKIKGKDAGDVADGVLSNLPAAQGAGTGAGAGASVGSGAHGLSGVASTGLGQIQRLFGGVRVSSGRRSAAENARVGGAPNSDHLTGNALDLVPAGGWTAKGTALLDRVARWARKNPNIRWIGWRGVPNHGPGDHLHLSFRPSNRAGDVIDKLRAYGGKIRGKGDVIGDFRSAIRRTKAGPKASLALFEAGIVESGLRNLNYGDRDSLGPLQVRESIHGRMTPLQQATTFLTRGFWGKGSAIELARRNPRASAGWVAQQVQGSAYPERYDQVRGRALAILGSSTKSSSAKRGSSGGSGGSSSTRASAGASPGNTAGRQLGSGPSSAGSSSGGGATSFEGALSSADLEIAEAEAKVGGDAIGGSPDALRQAAAVSAKRRVIGARIKKIRAALKKKGLRPSTRIRLQGELATLLGEHSALGEQGRELRTAPTLEEGEGDPNQPLIDAINAKAEQDREILEANQRMADELKALREEEVKRNAFNASVLGVTLAQVTRALGDVFSGELAGRVTARGAMPNSGALMGI